MHPAGVGAAARRAVTGTAPAPHRSSRSCCRASGYVARSARSRCRWGHAPSRQTSRRADRAAPTATAASGARTSAPTQAELREYLHQLLAGRERLAAAIPQLAEWARRDATPSDDEIHAVRALVRRNEQILEELDPADRAAVLEAIATTRRLRAQLAVTIPERFKGITRPPRPTLHPRPASATP